MTEKNTNIELLAKEARESLHALLICAPPEVANDVRRKQAAYLDGLITELKRGKEMFEQHEKSHAAELERVREDVFHHANCGKGQPHHDILGTPTFIKCTCGLDELLNTNQLTQEDNDGSR